MRTLYLFLILITSVTASAMPTMVGKGYLACATCHVNANGGGLLTPYGSGIARDVLSMSDSQALTKPTIAEWITYGGDLRTLQTRANAKVGTQNYTTKKFTLMQADFEVSIGNETFKAVGTVGYQNPASNSYSPSDKEIFSRRHYAQFVLHPNLAIQAGRLNVPYGPDFAEHYLLQKSELGFGEGREGYQVQATYSDETIQGSAYVGYRDFHQRPFAGARLITGQPDKDETYLIGFNTYFDGTGRVITGPELIGIYKAITLFLNLDFDIPRQGPIDLYRTLRLNAEIKRGIHLFAIGEWALKDIIALTAGVNLYPIEHFEIQAAIQFSQFNIMWLMGHLWL